MYKIELKRYDNIFGFSKYLRVMDQRKIQYITPEKIFNSNNNKYYIIKNEIYKNKNEYIKLDYYLKYNKSTITTDIKQNDNIIINKIKINNELYNNRIIEYKKILEIIKNLLELNNTEFIIDNPNIKFKSDHTLCKNKRKNRSNKYNEEYSYTNISYKKPITEILNILKNNSNYNIIKNTVLSKHISIYNSQKTNIIIMHMIYETYQYINKYEEYIKICIKNLENERDNIDKKEIKKSYLFKHIYEGYFDNLYIQYEIIDENNKTWRNKFINIYTIKKPYDKNIIGILKKGLNKNIESDSYVLCKSKNNNKWNIFPHNTNTDINIKYKTEKNICEIETNFESKRNKIEELKKNYNFNPNTDISLKIQE
jgi:hypothetical protein